MRIYSGHIVRGVAAALIACAMGSTPSAQAYCALRDPVTEMRSFYPESSSYRTIVRSIDGVKRKEILERVGLELHFNELGRHSLYVSLEGLEPVGLVHVRSEPGRRGLIEVAWSLDLDLRVVDFRFQRCREPGRAALETGEFRAALRGLDPSEMRALLSANGAELLATLPIDEEFRDLAAAVIRCGVKTQFASEIAWGPELVRERMTREAVRRFPTTESLDWIDVGEPGIETGDYPLLSAVDQKRHVRLIRARGENGELLGSVVRSRLPLADGDVPGLWSIAPEGRILDVHPTQEWTDQVSRAAFETVRGSSRDDAQECQTSVEALAHEVLRLAYVRSR